MGRLYQRYFDAGGGGGALVEVQKPFELDDPKRDVPEAIEKIRAATVELDKRGELKGESFQKVVADLEEVRKVALEARETARDAARQVPGPGDPDEPIQSLKHVSLGLGVEGEQNDSDKNVAKAFTQLERAGRSGSAQYNLLTRTPKSLGITDEATARQLRRLHALHDATVFINESRKSDVNYLTAGGPRSLPWWDEMQALGRKFRVSLAGSLADASTNEGKEWVPVNILSATVQELIELELQFASAFQTIPMAGPTIKLPVRGAHAISYYIEEHVVADGSGDAATKFKASTFKTADATFTAKKHGALVYTSSEWEQDAVVNVPAYIESAMAVAIARGIENALVNGQPTQFDGGSLGAQDVRKMWKGARRLFRDSGAAARDLGAGLTAEDMAAMFGAQGAYGASPRDCIWLTSTAGLARLLVLKAGDNSPVALTMAQMGNAATFLTGALAQAWGRRVYVSEFVSEKMEADGTLSDVDAPAGNKTAIYHINTRPLKLAERLGVVVSRSEDLRFVEDQLVFKAVARHDFQSVFAPGANDKIVMEGNNIATF